MILRNTWGLGEEGYFYKSIRVFRKVRSTCSTWITPPKKALIERRVKMHKRDHQKSTKKSTMKAKMECDGTHNSSIIIGEDRAGIGYAGEGGSGGKQKQRGGTGMIMKPCPRCKRMMPYGPAYCKECAPIAQAELEAIKERNLKKKQQQYNNRRDPKYLKFYRSKDWKRQSRAKLESVQYKCEARLNGCQTYAVEVHHIKHIQTPEGWDKRLEWENLEAVCTSCHNGRHPEKLKRRNDDGVIDLKTINR